MRAQGPRVYVEFHKVYPPVLHSTSFIFGLISNISLDKRSGRPYTDNVRSCLFRE